MTADLVSPEPGPRASLAELRQGVLGCRACPLWEHATQSVPGSGPAGAQLVLVGEQPGDKEDVEGEPFVGPAGGLLDRALHEAGVVREAVFVTNAVKHFKWEPSPRSGERRLHKRPNRSEVLTCRPWLVGEIAAVRPQVIVCLGATAAQSLLGASWRVSEHRGQIVDCDLGVPALATVHPSAVLRVREVTEREAMFAGLVDDLSHAAEVAAGSRGS